MLFSKVEFYSKVDFWSANINFYEQDQIFILKSHKKSIFNTKEVVFLYAKDQFRFLKV